LTQNRLPHLHSTPPLGGPRRNIAMAFGMEKLARLVSLPHAEKHFLKIRLFVLTEFTNATDTRTDRQTDRKTLHDGIGRACKASRGNRSMVKTATTETATNK